MGICRARLREGLRIDAVLVRQRDLQGAGELRLALPTSEPKAQARRAARFPIDASEPNPFGLLHCTAMWPSGSRTAGRNARRAAA